jgi:hypothetical protein
MRGGSSGKMDHRSRDVEYYNGSLYVIVDAKVGRLNRPVRLDRFLDLSLLV